MNTIKKITTLFILCLVCFAPNKGFSTAHVTMTLLNPTSTSTTVEYDLFIVNDGTTALKLAGFQFGVNFANYILFTGTPGTTSYTFIAGTRDPAFALLTTYSTQYNNNQLKGVSTPVPLANTVNLPTGVPMRLGRFMFTNTTSWYPGSMPNFQFQLATAAGKTQCVAVCYVDAASTSTPLQNATSTLNGSTAALTGFALNFPLPVSLSSFSGTKLAATDLIEWSTSQEENNSYFDLQHSTDGTNFETIETIKSNAKGGNSASLINYSASYSNPKVGHNYYRLKQVDIDGKATIATKIIDLERSINEHSVSLFPNPATNLLNVNIVAGKSQNTLIKVLDINGRVLKSVQSSSLEGLNTIIIDVNDLAVGAYLLQVFENNKMSFTDKFRKID